MILRPISLDQPVGTLLSMTIGPITNRNWFNSTILPAYSITISPGATGAVALQGTNSSVYRAANMDLNPVEWNLLPAEGASWSDIQAATSTSVTGTFNTSYRFLQLVITTQGSGTVGPAWVLWN